MNRIALLRKEKGMTQVSLAIALNISQKMISAYENNKCEPSINTLKQIADIFGTSVDYLIGYTDIKKPLDKLIQSGLSESECELINIYRELPENKQNIALGIVMGLTTKNI